MTLKAAVCVRFAPIIAAAALAAVAPAETAAQMRTVAPTASRLGSGPSLAERQRASRLTSEILNQTGFNPTSLSPAARRGVERAFGARIARSMPRARVNSRREFAASGLDLLRGEAGLGSSGGVRFTASAGDLTIAGGSSFLGTFDRDFVRRGFGFNTIGTSVPFIGNDFIRTNGFLPVGPRFGSIFDQTYIGPIDGQLFTPPIIIVGRDVPGLTVPLGAGDAAGTIPPEPQTLAERVVAAVAAEDLTAAADLLEEHLNSGNERDAAAMRMLALVRLAQGNMVDGSVLLEAAYERDPALARSDAWVPLPGPGDRRQLLGRAVRRAHDEGSGQAWLAVLVLMQAQGKLEPARRMLDRAETGGLDPDVVDSFREVLTRSVATS